MILTDYYQILDGEVVVGMLPCYPVRVRGIPQPIDWDWAGVASFAAVRFERLYYYLFDISDVVTAAAAVALWQPFAAFEVAFEQKTEVKLACPQEVPARLVVLLQPAADDCVNHFRSGYYMVIPQHHVTHDRNNQFWEP